MPYGTVGWERVNFIHHTKELLSGGGVSNSQIYMMLLLLFPMEARLETFLCLCKKHF